MKRKIRFALIGAGWRAMYYVRIAKALPDLFEMVMMLCTSKEKAEYMQKTYHIPASADEADIRACSPDLIVIAAAKSINPQLSIKWMKQGFYIIAETPAGTDLPTLEMLCRTPEARTRLIIAEQYRLYPENIARLHVLRDQLIGQRWYLYLSLAHDYHAASLMRSFLGLPADSEFSVRCEEHSFPFADTLNRYQRFEAGHISDHRRTAARFAFAGGAVCLYDFDSEQYRSPIAGSHFRLQGTCGEFSDSTISWLDDQNHVHRESLNIHTRTVRTDSPNPNLSEFEEITGISFQGKEIYTPPFGVCGLSLDETAVALLMQKTKAYTEGEEESPYPIEEALADAYTAVLMRKAAEENKELHSDMKNLLQLL